MATWNLATVEWNGASIAHVVDFSVNPKITTVDCSTIDSLNKDNRNGTGDSTATLTVSLKDGNDPGIAVGGHGVLEVTPSGHSEIFSGTLRCDSITMGGGNDAHATAAYNFVSTEEAIST
jgi:hypothetical protein